ncbi:polysaccharide deacetylase family protein [Chitinophaga sp. Hz27]|uniref:polysaccharide deacetylase family protein n=1 Tax=Chitinophaga sp. Hz27 TaxID=3347169 RepID=UPI0035DBFFE8
MYIYLTFDDGIQPGTGDVLHVLKEAGIPATFFLTGIHTQYQFQKDERCCLNMLHDIYKNHVIGNHSYSHANEYYSTYYSKGLLIDNDGNRRSITEDFEQNEKFLLGLLSRIYGDQVMQRGLRSEQQELFLARLPGRNVWYHAPETALHGWEGAAIDRADAWQAATALYNKGNKVYGWHSSWEMQFDFSAQTRQYHQQAIMDGTMDYTALCKTNPNWDMYATENIGNDRLLWDAATMLDKISQHQNKDKMILLMHDRAFRTTKLPQHFTDINSNPAAKALQQLICQLKEQQVIFDTLDHY